MVEVLNMDILDSIRPVTDEDAYHCSIRLGKEEGISAGISAGAACYAACKVAEEMGPEKNIVVIIPDTAERYFSFYKYF